MLGNRELSTELLVVVLGRITLAISGALLLVVLLRILDATEYSQYVFLFSTASWLSALIFVGANIPFLNFVSNKRINDSISARSMSNIAMTASLYCYPISAVATSLGAFFILYLANYSDILPSLWLCISIGLLSASIGCVILTSTYLMGVRRRVSNTLLNSGFILLRVLLVTIVAAVISNSTHSIFFAVTLAACIGFLCSLLIAYKPIQIPDVSLARLTLAKAKFSTSYFENWPVAVGNNIFIYGDKVFLSFLLPIEAIGLLSIYQQFCRMLASMTSDAIYQFAAPILLNSLESGKVQHRFYLTSVASLTIFALCAVPAYFALSLVNETRLLGKFTVTAYEYALAAATIGLNGTSRITELNFFKSNRIRDLHLPLGASIATFIVLGSLFAINFGIIGALWSLLIAALIRLLCTLRIQSSAEFNIFLK